MTRSGCRRSCWGLARRCWAAMATITSICRRGRWRAACRFPGSGQRPHRAGQAAVADQPPDRSRPGRSRRRRRRRGLQPRHRQSGRGADLRADQCPSFRRTGQREPGGRQPADHQWHRAGRDLPAARRLSGQADAAGRGLRRRGAARELRPDQHGRAAPERGGRRQSLLHRRHRHAGRHRRRPRQRSGQAQRVPDRPAVRAGPAAAQCGGGRPDRYRAHHAGLSVARQQLWHDDLRRREQRQRVPHLQQCRAAGVAWRQARRRLHGLRLQAGSGAGGRRARLRAQRRTVHRWRRGREHVHHAGHGGG